VAAAAKASHAATPWRVLSVPQAIDEPDAVLRERAAARAGLAAEAVRGLRIAHRSLDARKRGASPGPRFVVHVDLTVDAEAARGTAFRRARRSGRVQERPPEGSFEVHPAGAFPDDGEAPRALVVGAGPAGLLAAWTLARNGARVDLLDRGPRIDERSRGLARFLRSRRLDPECNLLFGEGGAGTYSDGKIYTRVDDPLELPILRQLVACGAPEAITYDSRAHIGTDKLHRILPELRRRMEAEGVRFRFGVRLEGLVPAPRDAAGGRLVTAARTSAGEVPCDAVFLGLGHSARDTLRALEAQGLRVESKPFQLGVRIEHPQDLVDRGRYGGDEAVARALGPSYYGLVARATGDAAAAHSFCMCPGGQIVASVQTPGLLCTNGMSNSRHSSRWANAAIVTTLGASELGDDPWAGVRFQEELERRAFELGGSDYTAPAQRAPDFLAGRETRGDLGRSSYRFGIVPGRLDAVLPDRVRDALRHAIARFDRQIPGFASEEGLLVGVETRSSSAQRVPRDRETRLAVGFDNVYPIGEGAGYAGGIMSAAIDGAKSAQAWVLRRASASGR